MKSWMPRTVAVDVLFVWRAYLASSVILVPAVVVPRLDGSGTDILAWTTASMAGYLSIGAMLLLVRLAVHLGMVSERVTLAFVACVGAVIGFLKGQITAWTAVVLGVGLDSGVENLLRSIPATGLGAATFVCLAVIISAWREFVIQWQDVTAEQVQAETERLQEIREQDATVDALRELVETRLNDTLESCRDALQRARNEPVESQWDQVAQLLREAADSHVRPLTRDLWVQSEARPRVPSPWSALWSAREQARIPILLCSALIVIALVPAYAGAASPVDAVRLALLAGLAASAVLIVGNQFHGRMRAPWLLTTILTGAASGAVVPMLGGFVDQPASIGDWLLSITWITLLAVGATVLRLILRSESSIVDAVRRQVAFSRQDAVVVRRSTARLYRQMAQYLHGTVQSRLMASALIVDSRGERDPESFREHLRHADDILRAPLAEFGLRPAEGLSDAVHAVVMRWSGVLDVDVRLPESVTDLAATRHADICAVLEEALANASRHGLAARAWVALEVAPGIVDITVRDDGVGPRAGEPGLGSALFDAVAPLSWSLTAASDGDSGSVLRVRLAADAGVADLPSGVV